MAMNQPIPQPSEPLINTEFSPWKNRDSGRSCAYFSVTGPR